MQDNRAAQRYYEPDMINIRRKPYLEDYEGQRRRAVQRQRSVQGVRRDTAGQGMRKDVALQHSGQSVRRDTSGQGMRKDVVLQRSGQGVRRDMPGQNLHRVPSSQTYGTGTTRAVQPAAGYAGRPSSGQRSAQGMRREVQPIGGASRRPVSRQSREAMLRERQRRRVRRQRMVVGLWAVCIIAISGVLFLNRNHASAAEPDTKSQTAPFQKENQASGSVTSDTMIQGLPVEKFTSHPEWKEDFLTPNEYSRPGEPLTEVKDVFVHYTANPGTSAAQNRSYFEQQKDVHMASVSSHFIIGYEGEIIQCVPLDEIAYAVAGRNYDSVSIECCFTAQDGSFTQETYDSLISLLAWLTDVYDLDTDHILRHYDCGGKKCPIYYTEHEDKWEKLKRDVKDY